MIAIIDYGVGNLFSLKSSFAAIGAETVVTSDEAVIRAADKIVLPGVGAFRDAKAKLDESGLASVVREVAGEGKPLLGICLGMQMLFERSFEYGEWEGLGLLQGEILPIKGRVSENLKIPHIGWNALRIKKDSPILKYVKDRDCVYFVHSYFADGCEDSLVASAEYGIQVTAVVNRGNIFGCQFHPEKSGEVGLAILRAFAEL